MTQPNRAPALVRGDPLALRTAFAAATDDPEDHALIATIAWICANERLPIRDRLEAVGKIVNLAGPA